MVDRLWTPDRGDLVWLTFDPQARREQAGRRPALVLSPGAYNAKTGLSFMCPITSQQKGYPFEVPLPAGRYLGSEDHSITPLLRAPRRHGMM